MKTFKQFLQILSEKKKEPKFSKKQLTKGIVVKPKEERDESGVLRYTLGNPPVPTKPGSPERTAQIKVIQKNSGASSFNQ